MNLLDVNAVDFAYRSDKAVLQQVSFAVEAGASLGIVGESGSGKTTLLRLLLGLSQPSAGSIALNGARVDTRDAGFMRSYRRQVQAVFQDPYSSLDPRRNVFDIIAEPLRSLRVAGNHEDMVGAALDSVGLPQDSLRRYPHQFSGGQRQRIAIARAIVARPQLLLADEAVSALDLTTRVRIVALLQTLAQHMTLVFVSHDLGVVAALCRDIVVLERGRIVEAGRTQDVLGRPKHPYTQALLASVPRMPEGLMP
ncbi:ATP-binding cassette domain-containing protein [Devosia aquimaris]|uniref:ATP-binding cassette domain-containing protein n=1 Tax=Devosia aquimaris TaxID=2866214 RepID=UPI001CD09DD1|nr:ABC transporter ATP-binding protein [Devosia sp. CJK-A8-3]